MRTFGAGLARHQWPDIAPVDDPVGWRMSPGEAGEGGEEIHVGGDFRRASSGGDMSGPAHDRRHAHSAFPSTAFATSQGSSRSTVDPVLQPGSVRSTEAEREVDLRLERVRAESEVAVQGEQDVRVEQAGCSSDRDALRNELRLQEQALRELERAAVDLDERRATALRGAEKAAADSAARKDKLPRTKCRALNVDATSDRSLATLPTARRPSPSILQRAW